MWIGAVASATAVLMVTQISYGTLGRAIATTLAGAVLIVSVGMIVRAALWRRRNTH